MIIAVLVWGAERLSSLSVFISFLISFMKLSLCTPLMDAGRQSFFCLQSVPCTIFTDRGVLSEREGVLFVIGDNFRRQLGRQ